MIYGAAEAVAKESGALTQMCWRRPVSKDDRELGDEV